MHRLFARPGATPRFRAGLEQLEVRAQPALAAPADPAPAAVDVAARVAFVEPAAPLPARASTHAPAAPDARPPDGPAEPAVGSESAAGGVAPWVWAAVVAGASAGSAGVLHRPRPNPAPQPDERAWRTYLLGLDTDRR